ncbi:MAG: CBS domain-containing protein [Candidatus Binataceae bacterium]
MAQPFLTVLCPVAIDNNSIAALEVAANLARQSSGRVVALHVVSLDVLPSRKADLDFLEIQEKGAQQWLQATASERLQGVAHELLTRSGRPEVAILHAAEECGADVIVMATHSHTIVPHTFCGSVAEKVLCQSRRPVLMVPARFGGNADLVAAWMTRSPQTVEPQSNLAEVSERMRKGGLRCMPVMDNGHLVGIITDHDVRSHAEELEDVEALDAMTTDVVTITPDTSIQEAARLLIECKVGGLPVLKDGILAGIITTEDILKFLLR